MKKSIVLITKNSPEKFKECVDSIFKWILPPYELIIIDNSNLPDEKQEHALQLVESVSIKNVIVQIIKNGKNLGSSKARNQGMQIASGDYITFIDDDAYFASFYDVGKDVIDYFISIMQKDLRIGIVGPCVAVTPRLNFTAITTALMTIPQKIKMYGFRFDERMGHNFDRETNEMKPSTCGYEDVDFSYQVRRGGYKLIAPGWEQSKPLPFFHPMPDTHEDWEFRKKLADENTARIFNEKWKQDLDYWAKYNEGKEDAEIEKTLLDAVSNHPNNGMFKEGPKIYPFTKEQDKIHKDPNKVKLNLGSGDKYIDCYNWKNVDLFAEKADVRCTVENLEGIENDSVDMILASHVIEHFRLEELQFVFNEWHRVLKPEGHLILEFPDCLKCFDWFIKNQNVITERLNVTPQILGSPYMPGHSHFALLDADFMRFILGNHKFKNIAISDNSPVWNIKHFITRIDCQK